MKKSCYILMIVALVAAGCRNAGRNGTEGAKAGDNEQSTAPSEKNVIRLVPIDGAGKTTIRKTAGESVLVELPADGFTHLHAAVAPVGVDEANLRISAIILPDGTTDGPFGREIDHDIPSSGTIRLKIGENTMQGDQWGGDIVFEVVLTK